LLSVPAAAQKLHVKVVTHTVDGKSVMRVLPGVSLGNGNAYTNCAAYGNAANCSGTASGSSVSIPAHTQEFTLAHIQMLLLLPDGRRVGVYCNDRPKLMQTLAGPPRIQACKNPEVDEIEADFSGEKVKLTWGVGLDGKKKVSETYVVGPVYPAPTDPPKP
jgi:hypothetical protein